MVIVEQQWRDQTANISQQFRENRWGQYKCPECNEYTMRVDLVDIFGTNMVTGEDIGYGFACFVMPRLIVCFVCDRHNEYTCLGCGYMDG